MPLPPGEVPLEVPIDPNGNLTQKVEGSDTWVYSWNAENQLTKVEKNGVEQARFSYDPKGRRAEKVAGGVTTTYTYDRLNILRGARGPSTFKYTQGLNVDEPLAAEDGAGPSYFHADGLGSVVKTTDAAGAVTLTRQYDAWGNPQVGANESGYAFTGREWDPETGLYFYRARHYAAPIGRFVSEDPGRFVDGPNFYRYVRDNPVKLVDPTGLCSCGDPCTSGQWAFDSAAVSLAFGFGLQIGFGKLTCKGNPGVSRWARAGCVLVGPYLALSAGITVQIRGVTISGPCRPEDLGLENVKGYVFGFGTPSAGTGTGGGLPETVGAGLGPGAGVAYADCMIRPL